ncbi:MAG: hypothetical protein U0835_00795 [Isosphaeraceae bacterium]
MGASSTRRKIDWPAVLAEFRRSGLSHVRFCSDRGLSVHTFRRQLYRLRVGLPPRRPRDAGQSCTPPAGPVPPSARATRPAFLPFHIRQDVSPATTPAAPAAPLELVLGGRHVLRVPAGFDADSLRRLLDVLEARP